jgi:hypothetical protein
MNNRNNPPVIVPDYHSEENWEAFKRLFPKHESVEAGNYADAAKRLNDFEKESVAAGTNVQRVKVNASKWEAWINANKHPMTRDYVTRYAMVKFADQTTGDGHDLLDLT